MQEKEMSFLDHLEELRWHLVRALIAVVVLAVAAFARPDIVFDRILLGPSKASFVTYRALCRLGDQLGWDGLCIKELTFHIQNRTMAGQFTTHIWISILTGLILAFPYIFWEIWRFIRPALRAQELRLTRGAVAFVSILFAAGVSFGYFILAPMTINFLTNYQISDAGPVENSIDLSNYISTLTTLVLACGLMFQLPSIIIVLTRAGIVSPNLLRMYRKHAFIVILIIAGLLTPSPDMFSQLLLGMPLYVLFEFSIILSARAHKALREAELEAELAPTDPSTAIA